MNTTQNKTKQNKHNKMGWQSYVLYYSNNDKKNKILQTIKNHNDYGKTCDIDDYTAGEELVNIINAELKTNAFS